MAGQNLVFHSSELGAYLTNENGDIVNAELLKMYYPRILKFAEKHDDAILAINYENYERRKQILKGGDSK